jgi:hypothetical protein
VSFLSHHSFHHFLINDTCFPSAGRSYYTNNFQLNPTFKTRFSAIFVTIFAAAAFAAPGCSKRSEASALITRAINNGRPVATGACCIANTSKKGDTCKSNDGTAGICASANTAGCELSLELRISLLPSHLEK